MTELICSQCLSLTISDDEEPNSNFICFDCRKIIYDLNKYGKILYSELVENYGQDE